MQRYIELLEMTSVHNKDTVALKGSGKLKNNVIFIEQKKITDSGKNFVDNTKCMYWNNPNELAEQLKLRIAFQESGNDLHQNDIAIIFPN